MDRNACPPHCDALIQERIAALSVNAAHREMAAVHYRHAVATAERAFEIIGHLQACAGTIRMLVGDRNRRVGPGLK